MDLDIVLSDLGCAFPKTEAVLYPRVQTSVYKASEVILGLPYTEKIDVFSVGCTLYEIASGTRLFHPQESEFHSFAECHLAQMISFFGHFPLYMMHSSDRGLRFFDNIGRLRRIPVQEYEDVSFFITNRYPHDGAIVSSLLDLINRLCTLDPINRPQAHDLLDHPFLPKTAHQ